MRNNDSRAITHSYAAFVGTSKGPSLLKALLSEKYHEQIVQPPVYLNIASG